VALALALVVGLVFGILPVLPWWLGALFGLVAGAALVWNRSRNADQVVLRAVGPGVADSQIPIRLANMVEGLTLSGGVIPPELVVLDDPARNGLAIRRHDRNHLVITTGLVDALDVVELEGAVADLLTRLRNGDAEAGTLASALFGLPFLDSPLVSVFGSLSGLVLGRFLPSDRDILADFQAVALTRYPPGLHRALRRIDEGDVVPAAASVGNSHLWLVDPGRGVDTADGGDARAPLSLRIDALAEL
jgi:heat shock protein HtpX